MILGAPVFLRRATRMVTEFTDPLYSYEVTTDILNGFAPVTCTDYRHTISPFNEFLCDYSNWHQVALDWCTGQFESKANLLKLAWGETLPSDNHERLRV